ncbi:MAG: FAD-binding protein, partial [Bacteroidales bacterium]|nr:FAD-binding protein [Bacteroidales bacterium]
MMKYDVVIIGAGLGGLECAYILAKNGLKVCILEK